MQYQSWFRSLISYTHFASFILYSTYGIYNIILNRGYVVSDFGQDGFALLRGDRIFIPGSEMNSLITRSLTVGDVLASPDKYEAPIIVSEPDSASRDVTSKVKSMGSQPDKLGKQVHIDTTTKIHEPGQGNDKNTRLRRSSKASPASGDTVIDSNLGGDKERRKEGRGKGKKKGGGKRKGGGGVSGRTKKELVL